MKRGGAMYDDKALLGPEGVVLREQLLAERAREQAVAFVRRRAQSPHDERELLEALGLDRLSA
jgi:hypothetical protein